MRIQKINFILYNSEKWAAKRLFLQILFTGVWCSAEQNITKIKLFNCNKNTKSYDWFIKNCIHKFTFCILSQSTIENVNPPIISTSLFISIKIRNYKSFFLAQKICRTFFLPNGNQIQYSLCVRRKTIADISAAISIVWNYPIKVSCAF